jgi:hypothetical protein
MTWFFLEISQDHRQWCHVSYLTRTTPTQAERRYDTHARSIQIDRAWSGQRGVCPDLPPINQPVG